MRDLLFFHKKHGIGVFVAWFGDKYVIRFENGKEIDLPIKELSTINPKRAFFAEKIQKLYN